MDSETSLIPAGIRKESEWWELWDVLSELVAKF